MRRPAIAVSTALLALALALGVPALRSAHPNDSRARSPRCPAPGRAPRQIAASTPGDFTGYGFDQCVAPTQAAMDAWCHRRRPSVRSGIYISGDSRACRVQPNLSPDLGRDPGGARLATAADRPRPAGLLPAALPALRRRLQDQPEARRQLRDRPRPGRGRGRQERHRRRGAGHRAGQHAVVRPRVASTSPTPTAASRPWRSSAPGSPGSRSSATSPGFYSSASSGIKMLDDARISRPGQFALPDRIWIARWDGVANTSTTYIPEDGWRPGGRMKQYHGGHNETWGGVTINIDSNYRDSRRRLPAPAPETHCGGTRSTSRPTPPSSRDRRQAAPGRRCSACSRRRSATPARSTATTTARPAAAACVDDLAQASPRPAPGAARTGWHCSPARTARCWPSAPPVPSVSRLQRALTAARQRVEVTGTFDEATRSALMAYQTRVGATPSGTTDARTWEMLARGRF